MKVTFEDLHKRLRVEGITDSKIGKFAEKMLYLIDDLDFIVHALKDLDGNMINNIHDRVKEDKSNKVKLDDYKKLFSDEESQEEKENTTQKEETEGEEETNYEEPEEPVVKKIQVQIKGEINNPGAYILDEGKNLNDLIIAAGNLTDNADKNKLDYLKVLSDNECIEIPAAVIHVSVKGAVKEPGLKELKKGSSVEILLKESGGLTEDADESSIDYFTKLSEGTIITVSEKEKIWVDIVGAVEKPGAYAVDKNGRLKEVIKKCGLTDDADITKFNQSTPVTDGEKIIIPSIKNLAIEDDKSVEEKTDSGLINDMKKATSVSEYNSEKKNEPHKEEEKIESEEKAQIQNTKQYIIETEKKVAEKNNRLIKFFKWIMAMLQNNMKKLPGSIQAMLEKVEDPVKLHILTQGYNAGLSKQSFTRLLKEQDKMSAEKMKHLINFYLGLENKDVNVSE